MQALTRPDAVLPVQLDGPEDGFPVIFANLLGTDLRLWDQVLSLLPKAFRFIRHDKRGRGLSGPCWGEMLVDHVDDAIAVIEAAARGPVLGLIQQAHRRETLMARKVCPGRYRFDIRLRAEGDTEFLDV